MSTLSARDNQFRTTVRDWLNQRRELLVLIRYSQAAGSKDFLLIHDFAQFEERIGKLPPGTSIIVFRQPRLPFRGVVDSIFIDTLARKIHDGTEYLALYLDKWEYGWPHWFAGETTKELITQLKGWQGKRVAIGPYPPWLEDNEDVISAIVPDADGLTQAGIY